jgi:hypothetical protein
MSISTVENLLRAYERQVRIPWDDLLAGPQKVWFAIYEPSQERRLRARITSFKAKTEEHGHGWHELDLTDAFGAWLGAHEYRDAYFEYPEDLDEAALAEFNDELAARVHAALTADDADERCVVALSGVDALFGFTSVSWLVDAVADAVRGRLLVFFPGQHEGNSYKFMNARVGWNYLAVPIEATNGA